MSTVQQRLNYIILEPVARPSVEQIRAFRELSLPGQGNMLQMRRVLQQGGFCGFGELLDDRAKELSSRLSAAGLPHTIGKTPVREVIFPRGKDV